VSSVALMFWGWGEAPHEPKQNDSRERTAAPCRSYVKVRRLIPPDTVNIGNVKGSVVVSYYMLFALLLVCIYCMTLSAYSFSHILLCFMVSPFTFTALFWFELFLALECKCHLTQHDQHLGSHILEKVCPAALGMFLYSR
jgi:hypothetical protein